MNHIKAINESFIKKYGESLYQLDVRSLYECLKRLNEAEISPEDKADSDALRAIYKKIDGKKVKLTPQELDLLKKYGIDAWGFRGDTKVVTDKGKKEVIQDLDIKKYRSYRSNQMVPDWSRSKFDKINYADRARKIDDRDYAQRMNARRYYGQSFQDAEREKENQDISKNTSNMKSYLKSRRYHDDQLRNLDKDYADKRRKAFDEYEAEIKKQDERDNYWNTSNLRDAQRKIDDLLDKHRLKECINLLNEKGESEEDKRDNELLRSVYRKTKHRSNAKLTPEEIAVLDKYGVSREGRIRGTDFGLDVFDYMDRDVNISDKLRKLPQRTYAQEVRSNTFGGGGRNKKSFQDREREHENDLMRQDVHDMKGALSNRKYYALKKLEVDTDKEVKKDLARQNLDKRLLDLEKGKERDRVYHTKSSADSQKEIDKLLKRESLKESFSSDIPARIIKTGLGRIKNGEEILDSVLGQMSDGIWENSPGMDKYWLSVNITDDANIEVPEERDFKSGWSSSGWTTNPYYDMSDDEVRRYFANKIKYICQLDCHDHNVNPYKEWRRDSDYKLNYMGGHLSDDVTIADAYAAYETLK